MASLGTTIDPSEHEERRGGGDVIPAGRYPLHAVSGDVEANQSGTGSNAWFQFEVLDGDEKGKQFRHYINNITHSNPDAQRIGQEELAEYCRAVGIKAKDTEDFFFKPFIGNVKFIAAGTVEKRKNGPDYTYSRDVNKVARYEAVDGSKGPAAPPQPRQAANSGTSAPRPAQAPSAAGGKAPPPWARKTAA